MSSVEWLEYLGKLEMLEDLSIKHCRAIGEGDVVKLGPSLKKLKRLQFEVDANYRYMKVHDQITTDQWKKCVPCDRLEELSLLICLISPDGVLSCVFGRCKALKRLHLDICFGVRDCDIVRLAQRSSNLKSISLGSLQITLFFSPI
ncbi:F-box/LRR-repeat protein [Thalictrum thalictroides]|uniref:F-box/LRR-repeat protein n=1 Tax=Thalictrum thalictroides TaxID=46969 RepID=A0A7J6W8D7_THATH|nr:F-box/LRR-repeat protein [Thalictrum thalictroides]